jgi:uncharacterized membrane protein
MNKLRFHLLKNTLLIYALVLAFLGFIDAAYLTITRLKNITPPCSVHFGCETVLRSSFSTIGPFDIDILGTLFYLAVIFICLLILIEGMKQLMKVFYFTVLVGFFFSIVLFLIQFLILKAFCQYCLLSELISAGLFVLSLLKFREDKKIGSGRNGRVPNSAQRDES